MVEVDGIRGRLRRFREWQQAPRSVEPLSDEQHACLNCDTEFQGNYCPRCGQSAKVREKMSLWKTILLFIDVWGVGNRGMFHTLRDLLLRPGYMICDYLRGKRFAYFPPFQLLFFLTTLSLLADSGFNILHVDYTQSFHIDIFEPQSSAETIVNRFLGLWNWVTDVQERYPALFRLGVMTITCGFYFIWFGKSKIIGKLSYHEFFLAMVYMVNMANIYSIAFRFFCAPEWLVVFPTLLYLIPLHQMSGYGWWPTLGRFALTWLMIATFYILLFFGTLSLLVLASDL